MRGDTSSTPIFQYPFNTTTEFIHLLVRNKHFFQQKAPYHEKKVFFFNFQYPDTFARLTQHFLYQLFETIQQHSLNIDVFTGSDAFVRSYREKCAGQSCSPMEEFIASSPLYLQSSQ